MKYRHYLQWHILHPCNLHCKHCYQDDYNARMSWDEMVCLLDKYSRYVQLHDYEGQINLTGGEPLLHPDFMRLLGEFDLMLIREEVPKAALYDYERSVINFYPVVAASYEAGVKDGTVRSDIDFQLFYLTFAHSMMELCKKILRGDLLPSDDFAEGKTELNMLIDMAMSYLKTPEAN